MRSLAEARWVGLILVTKSAEDPTIGHYHTWLSRERHLVECRINKLKPFRRIFSRFDTLDRSFLGFVQFVCAFVWVR